MSSLKRWFDAGRTAARRSLRRGAPSLPPTGQPAPDFDLLSHVGERFHLADLRGQRVVLWFFPKASTPG